LTDTVLINSAVVAAVVGMAATLITLSVNDKQSKIDLYAKTVSSFRMEWIRKIRDNLVELFVICKTPNMHKNKEKFERCRANILMRLNHNHNKKNLRNDKCYKSSLIEKIVNKEKCNDSEKILIKLLEDMTIEQLPDIGNDIGDAVIEIGTDLLKEEWERVKTEAGETVKKRTEIDLRTQENKLYKKK
jgi:hypothetical protein